ncbi:hypothetical protein RchiOBHm_Chr1g0356471 [Rosa chinensis]|uniref:Uncharacterized protein n=1 Tax=Rosa chinensis TaxID=74649 RepID=A0A2P6SHM7_ROSCH|nr:hypothetical protein RchiOBHm_Chr1g0356471 [Rosa chinensis]
MVIYLLYIYERREDRRAAADPISLTSNPKQPQGRRRPQTPRSIFFTLPIFLFSLAAAHHQHISTSNFSSFHSHPSILILINLKELQKEKHFKHKEFNHHLGKRERL